MNNTNPKVSICIPAYKEPQLIRNCLESIHTQTYTNYEVVVTDDSPDDTVYDVVNSFTSRIKNLNYYKNDKQKGSPDNWNESVRKATGEYIKILHHDDWFANKDSLKKYVEALDNNPHANFAFSASNAYGKNNKISFVHYPSAHELKNLKKNIDILFLGNFIGTPSVTIYRKKIGATYDKNLMWFVDVDFYVNVLRENSEFVYIDEPLANITADGDHQVTKKVYKNKKIDIYESLYLFPKINNNVVRGKYILLLIRKLYSYKLKQLPKKLLKKLNPRTVQKHISYSQCGEDLIVDYVFKQLGKENITYLDLGAHHPTNISNTYYFYKKGCRGVCVEPDITLFKKIKQKRPKDTCLNVGVGTKNEEANFYLMSSRSLNTFSKEEAERFSKNGSQKIEAVIKVQLKSVNDIIFSYFRTSYPNFISIDIEGLDYTILESLDFTKYRPEVFCVETLTYAEDNTAAKIPEIVDLMERKGYFVYADTYINTIFVDTTTWKNRYA